MYAIIGEDKSDVDTLDVLLKNILDDNGVTIKKKGYSGCAEMLIKGAKQLKAYHSLGCTRFIVCYDSDRDCPMARKEKILEKVVRPAIKAGVNGVFCALVPRQELEAWILADLNVISNVILTWPPQKEINHPEELCDPKEHLERLSRNAKKRPLYIHAVHNQVVAKYLRIDVILKKCPSFQPLFDFAKEKNKEKPGYCY